MSTYLRPYHPADLAGIYRVCLLVDAVGGARPARFHNGDLPGHVYAGPYAVADPGLAFVVADERGVGGYVVATADTLRFRQWLDEHWWPVLREQYPRRADPGDGTRDHVLIEDIHATPGAPRPWFATHPAQLHIKLADRLQGRGWGRRLMEALCAALRERGVPGAHLGVAAGNRRAIAFYDALGFTQAHEHDWGHTLVLDLVRPTAKEVTDTPD
ncbi:GNAT family N-acetyltransferase [Nocardia aurea]|uniref:GNAT family N-acetyltransferase n=1 Tax=Nocardia aurea TaxID=2144174 RepID=UPI000D69550F|nr:GNAT family N-acetyltransferase [Nocardia aurea]